MPAKRSAMLDTKTQEKKIPSTKIVGGHPWANDHAKHFFCTRKSVNTNHKSDNVDIKTNRMTEKKQSRNQKSAAFRWIKRRNITISLGNQKQRTIRTEIEEKKLVHELCTSATQQQEWSSNSVLLLSARIFRTSQTCFPSSLFERCLWVRRHSFIFGSKFLFLFYPFIRLKSSLFGWLKWSGRASEKQRLRHKMHCIIIFYYLNALYIFMSISQAADKQKNWRKKKLMKKVLCDRMRETLSNAKSEFVQWCRLTNNGTFPLITFVLSRWLVFVWFLFGCWLFSSKSKFEFKCLILPINDWERRGFNRKCH